MRQSHDSLALAFEATLLRSVLNATTMSVKGRKESAITLMVSRYLDPKCTGMAARLILSVTGDCSATMSSAPCAL
eukprot:5062101-Prymnesium_polylepis.2